jgi:hypothetical protein
MIVSFRHSRFTASYAHLRTETLKAERDRLTPAIVPRPSQPSWQLRGEIEQFL